MITNQNKRTPLIWEKLQGAGSTSLIYNLYR